MLDYPFFTWQTSNGFIFVLVYVDDIIVGSNELFVIQSLKHYLHTKIKIKDLEILKYFLGLEIVRSSSRIHICQKKYTLEILEETGFI